MEQHADCILSNGEPIGYFFLGAPFGMSSMAVPSSVFQSADKGREGMVVDYKAMKRLMPHFTDASRARQTGCLSTFILVETSQENVSAFDGYWQLQRNSPGGFYIFGGNCSSYASRAFRHAKILTSSIPGMDTPNNLYNQLARHNGLKTMSYSGHIGFVQHNGKLAVEIL
ncbi:MAG: hypothetical protein QM715_10645 [Nibricoccus sp.]